MANLVLSYRDDVIAPSDFHLPTDKDNVFLAWKWTNVDHMMYNRNLKLHFEREWANGFRLKAQVQHDRNEPTSALFYQRWGQRRPWDSADRQRSTNCRRRDWMRRR